MRIQIITLSDRAYNGEYEDKSGPLIEKMLFDILSIQQIHFEINLALLPDDPEMLRQLLIDTVAEGFEVVFTTGGSGIGPRDFTPDVVKPMLQKELPGIMEMIRIKYGADKPNALLSRSIAGVAGQTLIYTLPGSVKAVKEYMEEISKTLLHAIDMLNGKGH